MRIGLTFNLKPAGAEGDQFEEFDSNETIESLESAIRASGHEPVRLGWGLEMLEALDRESIDAVFNIAEGVGGRGRESQVPAVLEMLGIPCSGSDSLAIALTLDKALAKTVAKSAGIPTAPWRLVSEPPAPHDLALELTFPLFAKPANEGSSMGITDRSLCHNQNELEAALERLSIYGPTLIEEFLPGDEFTVGVIDGAVLGVMQVVPRKQDGTFIYSLDVKRDYRNRVDYRLVDAPDVAALALQVWRAFGLRDVARIDVRRDRHGVANFVEVNPLPGVHPVNSDLVILARLASVSHQKLIGRILAATIRRSDFSAPRPSPVRRTKSPGKRLPIAVAYNDDLHLKPGLNDTEKLGEAEVIDTAQEIASTLGATLVPVGDDITGALLALRDYDVVVNLCEGVLGHPGWEKNFALGLEMLGIANTSCEPIATGICTDKKLVKRILLASGISTPRFWHGEDGGTWIVKPSQEDAGIGIDSGSVCSSSSAIEARVKYIEDLYRQPALVEEFVDGQEINQSIYFRMDGPVVLPPGEIVFAESLPALERIVGSNAKWAAGSKEDLATRNRTPAVIDDTLRRDVAAVCLRAASVLLPGGYVRFDLRQSSSGQLWIVDINPNPDIGRDSGFRKALTAAGMPFADFLRALIMAAVARNRS
jgi:D-alanine-D-alanine ligase